MTEENLKLQISDIEKDKNDFWQGVKDCIPTLLGYTSIGFAAGIVGISTNLSVLEITLFAALLYAGAAQFIIYALLATNSPMSAIIVTTFIVNLRNFLLSMTIAPYFTQYSLLKNIGIGTLVTDESFGVAVNKISKGEKLNDRWMNGLNITAYLSWILACVMGALLGKWISNPEAFGLDFSLTAMFVALLVLQLQSVKDKKQKLYLSLVLYMVVAMVLLSFFVPSHVAVIVATVIVASIGVVKDK
ncbi:AzlC family ABC transporter permease [Priestia megaterium]